MNLKLIVIIPVAIAVVFTFYTLYYSNKPSKTTLNVPNECQDLLPKIETLKTTMINYMELAQPDYTESDVNECITILNVYVLDIIESKSQNEALEVVKSTILELNHLNNNCNGQLIETSERENIAEIINLSCYKKGYISEHDDITELWREW